MVESGEKKSFEAMAQAGTSLTGLKAAAIAAKTGDVAARKILAAAFAHAAFAAPGRIAPTYDAAAEGWFGRPVNGASILPVPDTALPIPAGVWSDFWGLISEAGNSIGAGEITARTAAIGGHLPEDYRALAATVCAAYPGVTEAAAQGFPDRFTMDALSRCPADSLGGTFYRLIVDNKFDLEVLDRDQLQLASLRPPLDYLNARMLQSHDLWHIVAGYETTKLHEVAISAFQMAQFGHSYSAMFLAVVSGSSAFRPEAVFDVLMELVLSAWVHGRRTPPMLGIVWEDVWHLPTSEVRARYGIEPYVSPFPADMAEQLEAAAA